MEITLVWRNTPWALGLRLVLPLPGCSLTRAAVTPRRGRSSARRARPRLPAMSFSGGYPRRRTPARLHLEGGRRGEMAGVRGAPAVAGSSPRRVGRVARRWSARCRSSARGCCHARVVGGTRAVPARAWNASNAWNTCGVPPVVSKKGREVLARRARRGWRRPSRAGWKPDIMLLSKVVLRASTLVVFVVSHVFVVLICSTMLSDRYRSLHLH